MRIRFLQTYTVQAAGGPTYEAGEVYDLPRPSAEHFLRKGRAEPCNDPPAAPKPAPPAPSPTVVNDKPLGAAKRGRPSQQAPSGVFGRMRKSRDSMAGLDDE